MPRFKLNHGSHSESEFPDGHPNAGKPIIFRQGDIFDSKCELLKHNSPGSNKFEMVPDTTPLRIQDEQVAQHFGTSNGSWNLQPGQQTAQQPQNQQAVQMRQTYEGMTVTELQAFAKQEGVNLGSASKKAEIIDIIMAANVD